MANIKPLFKNLSSDVKTKFQYSQCLLLISVGQEAHEGERFEATIDLINGSFKSCIVLLYDSLQRHTMALNSIKEPSAFHETAAREGTLWLERNQKYLNKLTILKDVTRWDMWLNHSNFTAQLNQLKAVIDRDPVYRASFEDTISGYIDRYSKRLQDSSCFNYERARELCFDYILEECAILCLWPTLQCQFEVYPNYHNGAIEATRKLFVLPNYPDLLHAIRLGFRNAKQVKPQHFALLHNEAELDA